MNLAPSEIRPRRNERTSIGENPEHRLTMGTEVTGKRKMNTFEAMAASTGELAQLLNHHYGDGTVYVPSGRSLQLYDTCVDVGLITEDGFITRQGRELIARSLIQQRS